MEYVLLYKDFDVWLSFCTFSLYKNKTMARLLITLIFTLSLTISAKAQYYPRGKTQNFNNTAYFLGFQIQPKGNSKVLYVLVGVDTANNNKIVKVEYISEDNFVLYGKGLRKCKANLSQENLFEKAGVDCGLILDPKEVDGVEVYDTLWNEMAPLCLPIYDIWKLRYSVDPHYNKYHTAVNEEDKGWAQTRYRPSVNQVKHLQQYGINDITDIFWGENMFKLFKDMQDEEWVENYKHLN